MHSLSLSSKPTGPALVFRPSPLAVVPAPSADPAPAAPADGPVPVPFEPVGRVLHRADRAELYRRRRLVALAVVAGLVLGLLSFGRQAGADRTPEAVAADAVTIVVQPGDTLWAIARSLAPGDDPRPLADALADLAGGTTLQPGQRIVVPGHLVD